MKKILLITINLFSLFGFSQITLKKLDGTIINDGDVISYTQATYPESYLGLKIYNSSNSDIRVKIKVISLINVTGSDFQLCINPICVNELIVGSSYPSSGSIIPANGVNGNYDHFQNTTIGNGSVMEFGFKLYQVNDNDQEIGNSVVFTYRYSPTLSTTTFESLESVGVKLKSSIIQNVLEITTLKNVQMIVYDLNGNEIKNQNLNSGDYSIDVSNFSSGVYILSFKNEKGQSISKKIIKK